MGEAIVLLIKFQSVVNIDKKLIPTSRQSYYRQIHLHTYSQSDHLLEFYDLLEMFTF